MKRGALMSIITKNHEKHINVTWFYDFVCMALLPVLSVFSILVSIWWAADVFDLTETVWKVFMFNFLNIPRVMLDCSAIAKGYGCDVVAAMLRRKGVENYMVEIGGEVVAHGISEKRLPWKIGVTKPTDDSINVNTEIQAVLNVKDMAMATSGNYRNFYYRGGKKYAHTIDPATGYPVQHSILSATVLAKHCAEADAYATAFMVMGMEKAQKVLAEHPELMAYLIYSDDKGNLQV